MRNRKAKRLRKVAKIFAETVDTTYNIGDPAVYYYGKDIEISGGGVLRNGARTKVGIPTTLQKTCMKYIIKGLKRDIRNTKTA